MKQVGYQYVNVETEFSCVSGTQLSSKKEEPKKLCCSTMKISSEFSEIDGESMVHGGGEVWYSDNVKLETKYGRRYWTISSNHDKLFCYTDVLSSKQCDIPTGLDWKCTRGSWQMFKTEFICSDGLTTTIPPSTKPVGEIPFEESSTSTTTLTSGIMLT